MKKPFLKRMGDFLEGKGFYIVLFLCVAAIGISGYYLFSSLTPDEPDAPVAGTAQITVTPSPRPTPVDAGLMNRPAATPAPEHTVPASTGVGRGEGVTVIWAVPATGASGSSGVREEKR